MSPRGVVRILLCVSLLVGVCPPAYGASPAYRSDPGPRSPAHLTSIAATDNQGDEELADPPTTRLRETTPRGRSAIPLSYGQAVTGTIAAPGQVVTYTFTAGGGDVILARLSDNSSYFDPEVRLYAPDSALLKSNWSSGSYVEITETLSISGTYTLLVSDNGGTDTADYGLYLQRLNSPGRATPIAYGETANDALTLLAEMNAYTFMASAGDVILAGMSDSSSYFDPEVRLYAPDGGLLNSD